MRGRKPGDRFRAKLRILEGHPAPAHPLPQSLAGPGDPPEHLAPEAAEVWRLIVMRAPPGLLQPADSIALEMLAVSTVRWRKAEAQVAKRGALQCDTDRRGKLQRVAPWAKVAATELRLVLDLSRSLGLTPLARSSVRVAPVAREARSEFERLLDAPVPGDFPRRNA